MEKNYKKIIVAGVILAIICVSVGFAALNTTLNINGTATAKSNTWSIGFANVANESKSTGVTVNTTPTISGTTLTFEAELAQPNDSYSFTVDVKNTGSIDAKLSATPVLSGSSEYLDYTVTYEDGTEIKAADTLDAGETKTLKVTVSYKDLDASKLPTSDSTAKYVLALTYEQA